MILSFAFFSVAQENASTDNNIFLDSDQDGLSDEEEKTYGTDPLEADTDGDGYSDGAEVKSGYDPVKPAPGDRIGGSEEPITPVYAPEDSENMTNDLMDRVTAMIENSAGTGEDVAMLEIESTVQEILETQLTEEDIPTINKDGIKIKLQNYENLSPESRKEKEKEDFIKYLTSTVYIISSNSPRPITTELDAQRVFDTMTRGVVAAITTGNVNGLRDIIVSAEKSLKQMEDIEVPEKEIDLHVKTLTFLNYALTFKNGFQMSYVDPISDLVELSKMQSFMESLAGYGFEIQNRLAEYDMSLEQSLGSLTGYQDVLDSGDSSDSENNETSDVTEASEEEDSSNEESSEEKDNKTAADNEAENENTENSDTDDLETSADSNGSADTDSENTP